MDEEGRDVSGGNEKFYNKVIEDVILVMVKEDDRYVV